ncbi:MAG: hypothetical protein M1825_002472 [Sarcosagium campestre]|nr:MAG: hypothetical protein M1825_002472 [Sarcosagium campestre]
MARSKAQWLYLAVGSGACASFNGVFAKLTTTELTTRIAAHIATAFGLSPTNKFVEYTLRAAFFGLNLAFNGVMWGLFTAALARGTSSTQVSIINTSSNFMLTALLGLLIFSEALPPLWLLGAALLVAGNVIIGRREEKAGATMKQDASTSSSSSLTADGQQNELQTRGLNSSNEDDDAGEEDLLLKDPLEPDGDEFQSGDEVDDPVR